MTRYYFDTRDNDDFVSDDIGVELATFEQVKLAASQAMADFAKDVLPGSVVRILSIEARDSSGPLLRVVLRFEIDLTLAR
jgi:hypothetical protein